MQGNQIEVLDESKKLSAKNNEAQSDKKANSHLDVRKMLSESHLKGTLQINFESLLFDIVAPTKTVELREVPKAVEAKVIDFAPVRQSENFTPVKRHEPRVESNQPASDAPRSESPAPVEAKGESRPVENDKQSEESKNEPEAKEASEADGDKNAETGKKGDVEGKEADGSELASQVKMMRVELSVQLQRSLSAAEIDDLAGKIEKLLSDDELDLNDLLAGVVAIVEDLIAKIATEGAALNSDGGSSNNFSVSRDILNVLSSGDDDGAENLRRYLRDFLKGLKESLTVQEQSAIVEDDNQDRAEKGKVNEALMKLFKKLDKPERLERAEVKSAAPEVETKNDQSGPKQVKEENVVRQARKEAPKAESRDVKQQVVENIEGPQQEKMSERQALDILSVRKGPRPTHTGAAAVQSVNLVSESSGSGKSADSGGQNFWQNSYNNSASQKGINLAKAAPAKPSAPLPSPNQIMDQIVQQTKIVIENGRGEATIKLQPESLGKVEMKVAVDGDKANVRFVVESMNVRLAIMENVDDLRKSLEYLGLEVEQITVMLQGEMGDTEDGDEPGEKDQKQEVLPAGWELDEDDESGTALRELTETVRDGSTVRYLV